MTSENDFIIIMYVMQTKDIDPVLDYFNRTKKVRLICLGKFDCHLEPLFKKL